MSSKIKYRRCISFNAATYVRFRNYCRRRGLAMAAVVDGLVNDMLDEKREPATYQDESVALIKAELAVKESA